MLPNVVVGAGIVGLSVARALSRLEPDRPVVVLDKEPRVGMHQTGNNSGVIHSGIYYQPGSLKAELAVRGATAMKRFCAEHDIPFDVPGKVIVATSRNELAPLRALYERGRRNGVPVRFMDRVELGEREPHVEAAGALLVETTGRVDYSRVAIELAKDLEAQGGMIRHGVTVSSVTTTEAREVVVHAGEKTMVAHRAVVCAGLHSDRVALSSGLDPRVRIIPFRGEYTRIKDARSSLVRGMVYPVPDPGLPFLGIHLTRGIDDRVEIGPNAVPALAREGYSWREFSLKDIYSTLSFSGAWRLASRYWRTGTSEIVRSLSGRALLRAAQEMLPELRSEDLEAAGAGVRAQAVAQDGQLVDDFMFMRTERVLHVLNAPSPAATAALVIGDLIAEELLGH